MDAEKKSSKNVEQTQYDKERTPERKEIAAPAANLDVADEAAAQPHPQPDGAPQISLQREPVAAAHLHVEPQPSGPDVELMSDREAERRIRSMSRRSFVWGAAAVVGTWSGLEWLGTRRLDNGVQWPLRRVLEVNENLSRDLFSSARLAPQFPKSMGEMPRANGDYGVASEVDPDWKLRLVGLADMSAAKMPDPSAIEAATDEPPTDKKGAAPAPHDKKAGATKDSGGDASDETDSSTPTPADREAAVLVTIEQIRKMPRTEIVTELKCIEGWSNIVHWAGVSLVDFLKKYPPATKSGKPFDPKRLGDLPEYVSMETPDGEYFVGLDMASALHPQTLLCYEMNGKPLTPEHGAPLRLAIPVKYGIKNIKNIGKIKFTDERPRDYWAELGYDWYAGH
jgi:hypothetical protein